MGLLDFVSKPEQKVAYLFPEQADQAAGTFTGGGFRPGSRISDVFVFQFWPQQVSDNYTPNYATKNIPGGSHPIFQWTSGNGRDVSFTAQFISEIREDNRALRLDNSDFRSRITSAASTSVIATSGGGAIPGVGPLLLPSSRYTVNVASAIAALQQYLYPTYDGNASTAKPPKKLILVLPGTKLGRNDNNDGILCIMRGASVTMESWFPNGELRAASVALKFSEIVQRSTGGEDVSNIRYIGAEAYKDLASKYTANISNPTQMSIVD